MHIGASRLNLLFNQVWCALALLFLLVQARPALGAQDKEWDEHMKAAIKPPRHYSDRKSVV